MHTALKFALPVIAAVIMFITLVTTIAFFNHVGSTPASKPITEANQP